MNSLQVGFNAGLTTWRGSTLSLLNSDFSSFDARMMRYDIFDLWYENVMFSDINAYVARVRGQMRLYRHIREIYNPVQRLCKLERAKATGGQIDWTGGLRTGAVPVVGADDTLLEAIKTVLKWSNWGTEKGPYVLQGAKKGDSYLKIIDDVARQRVRLEVLDPRKVRHVRFDEVGNIKWICIQYYMTDDEGKDFLFREEVDQNEFRYWRDYNLHAEDRAFNRPPDERYPNDYGFVPVRHVPHNKEEGSPFGRTSFAGSLSKIVQLNDIAAPVHDAVRLGVDPKFVAKGGIMKDMRSDEDRARDEVTVLNIPKDGDFFPVQLQLNIADGLSAMNMLIGEIERDMPQLSLQRIRESGGDASGVAIENSYSDASDLLKEIQANYDQGLIAAVQMAISIGAYRRYPQFVVYDPVKSFERGELDFYIKERDVFSDRLAPMDRIRLILEAAQNPAWPVAGRELGLSQEDIDLVLNDAREREAAQIAAATRAAMEGVGMDDEEDDEDVEEIEEIEQ